jgi:hypothetical protein
MSIPINNVDEKGIITVRRVFWTIKWNYRRLCILPFGICLGLA